MHNVIPWEGRNSSKSTKRSTGILDAQQIEHDPPSTSSRPLDSNRKFEDSDGFRASTPPACDASLKEASLDQLLAVCGQQVGHLGIQDGLVHGHQKELLRS